MKKDEFIELYGQVELMCGGSQEQAKRMANLVRWNLSTLAGAEYDSLYHMKNGVNKYRTLFFLEQYAKNGNNVEAIWRAGLSSIHYWALRDKDHIFNPLQESEITKWERKGEVA